MYDEPRDEEGDETAEDDEEEEEEEDENDDEEGRVGDATESSLAEAKCTIRNKTVVVG